METLTELDPATECAIPFTYKGKLYNKCANLDDNDCDLECFDWNWIMRTCKTSIF